MSDGSSQVKRKIATKNNEGGGEWASEKRERERERDCFCPLTGLTSSPYTVMKPDVMISQDYGQPATYYSISPPTHTHTAMTCVCVLGL